MDAELARMGVWLPGQRQELMKVLNDPHPAHNHRLWAAGFLKNVGATYDQVLDIIRRSRWRDFDEKVTRKHLDSIYQRSPPPAPREPRTVSWGAAEQGSSPSKAKKLIPFSGVKENVLPLVCLNSLFMVGALRNMFIVDRDGEAVYSSYPESSSDPLVNTFLRSVNGYDHRLLVIDLDGPSIDETFPAACAVDRAWSWDVVKYSGNVSFHFASRMPVDFPYDEMKMIASDIAVRVGVPFSDSGKDRVFIDSHMYHEFRMVRSFSVHFSTGRCSVPVDLSMDTVDSILERSLLRSDVGGVMSKCHDTLTNMVRHGGRTYGSDRRALVQRVWT